MYRMNAMSSIKWRDAFGLEVGTTKYFFGLDTNVMLKQLE